MSEFNPLDEVNLAVAVKNALESCEPLRMDQLQKFTGAGLYAIYYKGDFEAYDLLSQQNVDELIVPIYTGRAAPEGSRKGAIADLRAASGGTKIFSRLGQHRTSIEGAINLDIKHFWARYLVTKRLWVPMGEAMMISEYAPLWNTTVEGFGVNAQGSGRVDGKLSAWDTLHPGRNRVGKPYPRTQEQLINAVQEHLRQQYEPPGRRT